MLDHSLLEYYFVASIKNILSYFTTKKSTGQNLTTFLQEVFYLNFLLKEVKLLYSLNKTVYY